MGRSKHSGPDKMDTAKEYKTGSVLKAAKQLEESKKRKAKRLKEIMGQ
jgi:hypothetical protein